MRKTSGSVSQELHAYILTDSEVSMGCRCRCRFEIRDSILSPVVLSSHTQNLPLTESGFTGQANSVTLGLPSRGLAMRKCSERGNERISIED